MTNLCKLKSNGMTGIRDDQTDKVDDRPSLREKLFFNWTISVFVDLEVRTSSLALAEQALSSNDSHLFIEPHLILLTR
jgi:hypothetical protein